MKTLYHENTDRVLEFLLDFLLYFLWAITVLFPSFLWLYLQIEARQRIWVTASVIDWLIDRSFWLFHWEVLRKSCSCLRPWTWGILSENWLFFWNTRTNFSSNSRCWIGRNSSTARRDNGLVVEIMNTPQPLDNHAFLNLSVDSLLHRISGVVLGDMATGEMDREYQFEKAALALKKVRPLTNKFSLL